MGSLLLPSAPQFTSHMHATEGSCERLSLITSFPYSESPHGFIIL